MLVTIAPPDARRANALSRALRQACSVDVALSDAEGSEIGALRAAMRRVQLGVLVVERISGERVIIAHPDLAGPETLDENEHRVVIVERVRSSSAAHELGGAADPPGAHVLDSFVLLAALVHEAHGGCHEVFEPHIVPAPARVVGRIARGAYPPPSGSLALGRHDAWKARFLGAEHERSLTACDGRLVAENWSPFWNTLCKQLDAYFGGVYECFSPFGFRWADSAGLHEDLRGFKDDPIVRRLSGWATFHRTTVWILYRASGCWLELAPKFKGFAHGRAMPGRAVALELSANGVDARFWIAPSVEQRGNTPVRRMWSDDAAALVARARSRLAARRAAELIQRHARAASAQKRERAARLALRTQRASIEIQRHVRGWRTRVWREVVIIDDIPYAMPMNGTL